MYVQRPRQESWAALKVLLPRAILISPAGWIFLFLRRCFPGLICPPHPSRPAADQTWTRAGLVTATGSSSSSTRNGSQGFGDDDRQGDTSQRGSTTPMDGRPVGD